MQNLLSYAQAVKEEYKVQFVDGRITDIGDGMMSLNFLAAHCRETYIRYARLGKMNI